MENLRFVVSAILMGCGIAAIFLSVLGVFKFRFVMNRMHCAAIIDTTGLLFIVLSLIIAEGSAAFTPKLLIILALVWIGSPISSHLVGRLEISTDESLHEHMKFEEKKGDNGDGSI